MAIVIIIPYIDTMLTLERMFEIIFSNTLLFKKLGSKEMK